VLYALCQNQPISKERWLLTRLNILFSTHHIPKCRVSYVAITPVSVSPNSQIPHHKHQKRIGRRRHFSLQRLSQPRQLPLGRTQLQQKHRIGNSVLTGSTHRGGWQPLLITHEKRWSIPKKKHSHSSINPPVFKIARNSHLMQWLRHVLKAIFKSI
jgi:hypothetical protein